MGKAVWVVSFGLLMALAAIPARAGTVYVGDAALLGSTLPAGTGTRADTINGLSYIYSDEVSGVAYTATSNEQIEITSVNFLGQNAGSLTPFLALYEGGATNSSSNYKLLAKGDTLTVPAGSSSGVLFNDQFTVGGVNPIVSLQAGQTVVAGLFETTGIVVFSSTTQSATNDRIWGGNIVNGKSAGNTLSSGNSSYNFNETYFYDIGFVDVSAPEPGSLALLGAGLGAILLRRRAAKA